jgi:hypothetical protein
MLLLLFLEKRLKLCFTLSQKRISGKLTLWDEGTMENSKRKYNILESLLS